MSGPRGAVTPCLLDRDDRGQLLIIIALVLVVLFVSLALVLNSAIFTENLATRDADSESSEVILHQHWLHKELNALLDRTNARSATTDYDTIMATFEANRQHHLQSTTDSSAQRGVASDYWLVADERGVRLRQTDETRDFTDAEGNWDWTLMDAVPEGGQFTMSLQEGSLYETTLDTTLAALADSAFGIEFYLQSYGGEGDGVWRIYFFEGAATDNVYAIVEQPDQTFEGNTEQSISGWLGQACTAKGETISVRLRGGTFGGTGCGEFAFYDDVSAHEVRYVNARSEVLVDEEITGDEARVRGTYDILVGPASFNAAAFNSPGNGEPFHQAAIYTIWYSTIQTSSNIHHHSMTRRVLPTATDSGGLLFQHPDIDQFDITDVSDSVGDPAFEIEWAVSDTDGDLERVELFMVSVDNDEIVDRAVFDAIEGSFESGTTTLSDSALNGGLGDEYRLRITAIDASGRATTETETHVASS